MVKELLPQKGARPAAEKLKRMQVAFRHPPVAFLRRPFVHAVGDKGDEVDRGQLKNEEQKQGLG